MHLEIQGRLLAYRWWLSQSPAATHQDCCEFAETRWPEFLPQGHSGDGDSSEILCDLWGLLRNSEGAAQFAL